VSVASEASFTCTIGQPADDAETQAPSRRRPPAVSFRALPLVFDAGEARRDHPTTAASVRASPRSTMSKASRSSGSVMVSGGFVKNQFQRTNV
jgi:hypothetical protein